MGALVRADRQQARSAGPDIAVQQGRQYLTFVVAGEVFAIPISADQGDHRIPAADRRADDAARSCAA